ncbi:MAG: tRNA (adenosine(37)-N6)-threonylcarbamoyltransferase complex dimerization subunit type 1 TsaB [Burkholderiales bacterium]
MNLLAFDSSTLALSVACAAGDRVAQRAEHVGQGHSERLLPLVDEVLHEAGVALADLDAIAFGAGPGSFTGVRIACGVAQGLGLGAGVPLVPVPTLAALAQTAFERHGARRVLTCLDARMREVYVAAYERDGDGWRTVTEPAVLPPAALHAPDGGEWFGAGDGFAAYPDLVAQLALARHDAGIAPDARALLALARPRVAAGEAVDAADALPLYVRHRVALTTAERAAGARL